MLMPYLYPDLAYLNCPHLSSPNPLSSIIHSFQFYFFIKMDSLGAHKNVKIALHFETAYIQTMSTLSASTYFPLLQCVHEIGRISTIFCRCHSRRFELFFFLWRYLYQKKCKNLKDLKQCLQNLFLREKKM